MGKKSIWAAVLIAVCALAGIFLLYQNENEPEKKEPVQIAVSFCDTANSRTTAIWQDVLDSIQRAEMSVEWRSADADADKQKKDVRELLEYSPEYLVVMPVQTRGLEEELLQAEAAKTKIILLDRTIDNFKNISVLAEVRTDAVWEGEECARLLADFFDGREGAVLEISGEKGSSINKMHSTGFRNRLRDYENLEIAGITEGGGDRGTARNNVLSYFLSSPGTVNAVFANTDEEGIGAIDALEELGLRREVPVVSINGVKDVKNAIGAGGYLGCVEAVPYLGETLMEVIQKDQAKTRQDDENILRGTVYTAENLSQMQGY